jgi:hypothetical protein
MGELGALAAISALGRLGGAALAPSGTEFKSFGSLPIGNESITPRQLVGSTLTGIAGLGDAVTRRAEGPVDLRASIVQQPPTFTGGGLPMPIGLTGRDPAHADPSLLRREGTDLGDPFNIVTRQRARTATPRTATSSATSALRRPDLGTQQQNLAPTNDASEALGAAQLLLEARQRLPSLLG